MNLCIKQHLLIKKAVELLCDISFVCRDLWQSGDHNVQDTILHSDVVDTRNPFNT